MKPAIFLDRDGTIIKDKGYVNSIKNFVFYDFTFDCLKTLQKKFLLFIVTNQSGVSKGLISNEQLDEIHKHMLDVLKTQGIVIEAVYVCPHDTEDNCICRKPLPHFVHLAASQYNIDIANSYVIGDHPSDIQLALNTGAKGMYVLTGHGKRHYHELTEHERKNILITQSLRSGMKIICHKTTEISSCK
jgi:D-glycero-D-manno-heptose 1,7-bisphosphate phosphatase